MMLAIPGQILVVDDRPEDVEALIQALMRAGQGVIYVRGAQDIAPELERLIGVRLVVLDLDLNETGQVEDEDYELAALVLRRLAWNGQGFYLIAVWSQHVGEADIQERLQNAYREQTGYKLPGLFLDPFDKNRIDQEEVAGKIAEWIERQPHAGLVFEWEKLLSRARDYATSNILDLEGGSLTSLVKVLRKEVGESADRELVQLFSKVLLRYMTTGELTEIRELMNGLGDGGDIDLDWYARFHHFQTYYDPGKTEPVWTGDIFETGEDDHRKSYSIVITPQCDLAYGKGDQLKVVYAVKVGYKPEEQQPAFKTIWPGLSFVKDGGEGLSRDAEGFLNSVAGRVEKAKKLPERFYLLRFVRTGEAGFHLLVDLHNVHSIPRVEIEQKWKQKRVSRLDSPYIEDLMHRYAALSERVGVPAIPEEVCEAEAKRLCGK